MALLAFANVAHADNQLIKPAQAQLVVDWATFTAQSGFSIRPKGGAQWDETKHVLRIDIGSVDNATNPGPVTVTTALDSGFDMITGWGNLYFSNLRYDAAKKVIIGQLSGDGYFPLDSTIVTLWTSASATGTLGDDLLTSVTTSATARQLTLNAPLAAPSSLAHNFASFTNTVKTMTIGAVTASPPPPPPPPPPAPPPPPKPKFPKNPRR